MADIKRLFIVIILISVGGIAMFSFAESLAGSYGTTINANYTSTSGVFNNALGSTSNLTEKIQKDIEQSGGISLIDAGAIVLSSAFSIIKAPITLISIFSSVLSNITYTVGFGIPAFVFTAIIDIIILVIVLAILGAIFKKDI